MWAIVGTLVFSPPKEGSQRWSRLKHGLATDPSGPAHLRRWRVSHFCSVVFGSERIKTRHSHVRTPVPLLCFKSLRPFCGSSQTAHSSDTQTPQESQPCVYTFLQPLCGRASTFPCSTLLLFHIFQSFFLFSSLLTPSLPSCASLLQQKIVSGDLCPVMDWWPPPGCCPALFPLSDSDGSIALWPIRHIIWVNSEI